MLLAAHRGAVPQHDFAFDLRRLLVKVLSGGGNREYIVPGLCVCMWGGAGGYNASQFR